MEELTKVQLERQDYVDNSIYEMICSINPSQQEVKWNIEFIGAVRDVLRRWFVQRIAITDEMTFYPYLENDF